MSVPYFKAEEIAEKTWQIRNDFTKPGTLVTYAYLVEGENYALLIDTIMGWGNLKAFCETLTDKEIRLVNTHAHGDHTGGNYHFEECYLGYRDVMRYEKSRFKTKEQVMEGAKRVSREEYLEEITAEDFADEKLIRVYPLFDGDIFDMGDREIEVIEVPGHTQGTIVLIDSKTRIAFGGDVCNTNTLLQMPGCTSVEEYLDSLLYLKKYTSEFDMMYDGHEVHDGSIIDEGIELCGRVIARTDDKEENTGGFGHGLYGAAHSLMNSTACIRADGKTFNICYNPDHILYDPSEEQQVIR